MRWHRRGRRADTTTVLDLFGDTSSTTTIGGLVVPGWTPTELPDLWTAVDECVDLTEVGAEPLPDLSLIHI